jgi:hypothetical protein
MAGGGRILRLRFEPIPICHPPTLYLETTIPSYLVARRSPLARIAADQQTTQDWWDLHRHEYELFVSEAVLDEAGDGDPALASQRIANFAGLPRL